MIKNTVSLKFINYGGEIMNKSLLYILLSAILISLIFIGIEIFQLNNAIEELSYSIDKLRIRIPE